MADNAPRPLIIKRKKVIVAGGHHGGAWKVAISCPLSGFCHGAGSAPVTSKALRGPAKCRS